MFPRPQTCPECRTQLSSNQAARNGNFRCPKCGVIFPAKRTGSADSRLQTTPTTRRPANGEEGYARPRRKDEESAVREKNGSLPILWILGCVGLFFFLLLALGGGLAAFLYFESDTATVATAPSEAAPLPPAPPQPAPPPAQDPIQPVAQQQQPAGGKGTLPLKELKAASVYLKVQAAATNARGSGFVVHAQGDTVYVVTNHHVISPSEHPDEPERTLPPRLGPRMPGLPIGPRLPRRPRRGVALTGPSSPRADSITAVFYSGTAKEQSLTATVVGDEEDDDLAILRIQGVIDAPRPIDCRRTPALMETMPVVAFGFPFGEQLDRKKTNPAVTVTKGVISSLRGKGEEVEGVQLDLDLNPGNSGGPVVDENGALIGVAVAKVVNTRIGFAVPVPKLNQLLQGRIDPPAVLQKLTVPSGITLRVRAAAADPLGKLRSPILLYGLAKDVRMPAKGVNGWTPLADAKSSPLTIQGTEASATLALTPPPSGEVTILAQVSYQTATGQTIYGEPRTLSVGASTPPPPLVVGPVPPRNQGLPPAAAPRPTRRPKGEELTKLLAELKSADETARQRAASTLQQAPPRQRREEVRSGLQALLTATDPATRAAGVLALTACAPKEAAPPLANLLADDAPAVRQAVIKGLKELKDPRVAVAVAARLPVEPLPALSVLKAIGPAAEKALLPYLADKYTGGTRFWVFNFLNEYGTAASLPALEAIQGPEALHARNAIQAIRSRLPLTDAEWPQALDDLKSTDTAQRLRASRRLAATPPRPDRRAEVATRLEGLLNDRSNEVRIAAVRGIGRWSGPPAVSILAKRLEGFDPPLHAAVIDVLTEIKGDEAAAALAKRLPDVHDRAKVVQALKAFDAKVVEKAVLPLLTDANDFVRCEAVKVLTQVGGRASIAPLQKLADANNVFYSGLARRALEDIQDRLEDEK
jgi:S1-C subfamily serine protease/HEAT repeat protein